MTEIDENKQNYPLWYNDSDDFISPQWLIEKIHEYSKGEAIVTTDVGQHQMWAAQFYTLNQPNRWVTSGGLGLMGFGLYSAIGAKFGKHVFILFTISVDVCFLLYI